MPEVFPIFASLIYLWWLVQHTKVLTFKTTIPSTAKPLPVPADQ